MIFKTAYDTTACSGFVLKRTVEAVQAANVYGDLGMADNSSIKMVAGGRPMTDEIPAFAHPFVFIDSNKHNQVVFDGRAVGRWDPQKYEFVVTNKVEYGLALYRAKLTDIWVNQRVETLRDFSHLPMSVFAAWISESVGRRFALDPREQFELSIIAAVYYCSLFIADERFEEKDKVRIGSIVARAVRAKPEDVFMVLDQMETVPRSVQEFCTLAANLPRSVRLKDFNAGLLFAIMGGTWFGANAKEMVAVALEHPPTWIAILLSALNERSFKNATVAKTAERIAGRASGDFIRAAHNLVAAA